jgi:hypothetical protein
MKEIVIQCHMLANVPAPYQMNMVISKSDHPKYLVGNRADFGFIGIALEQGYTVVINPPNDNAPAPKKMQNFGTILQALDNNPELYQSVVNSCRNRLEILGKKKIGVNKNTAGIGKSQAIADHLASETKIPIPVLDAAEVEEYDILCTLRDNGVI